MGGRQAYEAIRKLEPKAKVLFTSGYTADFIRSRGELDQGMELLMKPVQPLDLLRKIRTMLDHA
jgi:CheY-like chemotaxis protein